MVARHPHHQRGTEHGGGDDDAERHPVGHPLQHRVQLLLVDRAHPHRELPLGEGVEDPVAALGQQRGELLGLDRGRHDPAGAHLEAAGEQVGEVRADRGGRVEVRVEVQGGLVEVEQRLADHRHLRGRSQPVRAGDPAQLDQDRAGLLVGPGRSRLRDQVGDLAAEGGGVVLLERVAHAGQHRCGLLAVAVADRQQQLGDLVLEPRRDRRHHAQVEQRQAAVVGEHQVAGVRVGVQHAVVEHQLEVAAEQLLDHRARVDVQQAQRPHVGHLAALDPLHGEHPRRRVVEDGLRHHEQVVALGQVPELQQVAGLAAVVQLAGERPAELLEQLLEAEAPAGGGVLVREPGQPGEGLHVVPGDLAGVGALDLDHDLPPAGQGGAVDLAEGGRGQRLALELREQVPDLSTELRLDDLLDLLVGERLGAVLEPGQRGRVDRRQQVEAGREQLAELDVRRAELLEVTGEGLGLRLVPHRGLLVEGELVQPGPRDQVGAAVPDEQSGERGVPADVAGGEECHAASMPSPAVAPIRASG